MKISSLIKALLVFAVLWVGSSPVFAENNLPDYLYSKGGIIYPRTGDSTQEIFRTPADINDFLKPGMTVGVLPADCISVSHKTLGAIYRCDYDFTLKPEIINGVTVYRVIDGK